MPNDPPREFGHGGYDGRIARLEANHEGFKEQLAEIARLVRQNNDSHGETRWAIQRLTEERAGLRQSIDHMDNRLKSLEDVGRLAAERTRFEADRDKVFGARVKIALAAVIAVASFFSGDIRQGLKDLPAVVSGVFK
jgi:chromosome segregation ATPase